MSASKTTGTDLPSGYEGNNIPEDFKIPPVGIEDVDRAMFELFKDVNPVFAKTRTRDHDSVTEKKVPVMFAAGERFAIRDRPFRDKSGTLITPLIAIKRTGISQARQGELGGSIGQNVGDLVFKKKISSKDPDYQNIINRFGFKNQDNVASDDGANV
jgi:hypothetical protein